MINGYLDFFGDSIVKEWEISCTGATFHNKDIIELTFNEAICSATQLVWGSSVASCMVMRTIGFEGSLVGQWLNVTCKVNGITYQIGRYKVLTDVPNGSRTERTITAYDALYDIINSDVADWYNTLLPNDNSTTTIGALRQSFLQHFGLTVNEATLVNDAIVVPKSLNTNQLSGKKVINDICSANGCFGHIDRDGNFKYLFLPKKQQALYPEIDRYPAQDLYPNGGFNDFISINESYVVAGGSDSTYMCEPVTKLNIRSTTDDVGVTVGTGDNTYVIEGNILLMGKTQEELEVIATNILGVISDVTYKPCNYTIVGNPLLEVGDGLTLRTGKATVYTLLLQRTLKGVQSLKDSISAAGLEKQVEKVNSVESQIQQVKGKTNELTRTIDETRSALSDLDEEVASEFLQTAQAISAKVGKTGGTQSFSWELTDSSWVIKSGDTVLFSVDTDDVTIRMKNQNVVIDDTGINFSNTATLKFSSITCFYLSGGFVGMGHPNFNATILANQLFFGTSASKCSSINAYLDSYGQMDFRFGYSSAANWSISASVFGPFTARSGGGVSIGTMTIGAPGFHGHAPATSAPNISHTLSDSSKISAIIDALADCGLINKT